jgi:hypothetical protein
VIAIAITDVKYAAIQECGGKTAAHVIASRDASVLAFHIGSQRPEKYTRPGRGLPSKRILHALVWLYACDPQISGVVPATQLNNMVDAVEAALAPAGTDLAMQAVQTLGGLVSHRWIEGSIEYYEGLDTNGRSVAVIPVAMLIPWASQKLAQNCGRFIVVMPSKEHVRESVAASNLGPHSSTSAETTFLPELRMRGSIPSISSS